jgi:hypothetical protein
MEPEPELSPGPAQTADTFSVALGTAAPAAARTASRSADPERQRVNAVPGTKGSTTPAPAPRALGGGAPKKETAAVMTVRTCPALAPVSDGTTKKRQKKKNTKKGQTPIVQKSLEQRLIETLCQILEEAPTKSMASANAGGSLYNRVQAHGDSKVVAKAAVKAAGGLGPFCSQHSSGRLVAQQQANGQYVITMATEQSAIPRQSTPQPPNANHPPNTNTASSALHANGRANTRAAAQKQAKPGASAPRSKRPDMRVDNADGKPYMHWEFKKQYGGTLSWPQQWENAEVFNVQQFKQTISKFAEELRSRWAANDENVSFDRVMAGIRTQYKVRTFDELRAGPFWEIDALTKLQMLDDKIHGRILAYIKVRSIGTLHDLEESIIDDEEVSSFTRLRIGPLLKHPLIKKHFQPAAGVTVIPMVTVLDVVGQLRDLMRRPKSRDYGKRFDAEDILSALASKRDLRGPLDLCCRIARHGIGMYITVISEVQMEERKKLGKLRKELERESMKIVVQAKKALEKELNEAAQSDENLKRTWHDTVNTFTKHLARISLEYESTDGQLAQLIENMFRDGKVVNGRVKVRSVDFRRLSALSAAYVTLRSSGDSVVAGHDILSELGMKPADIAQTIEAAAKAVFSELADMDTPGDDAANTASSLLRRIEVASCAELGIIRFEAMRQGSFLSFLQNHQLDRRWGPLRLGSIDGEASDFMHTLESGHASFTVPQEEVTAALEEILRHVGDAEDLALEEVVCDRLGVRNFKALGHGSLLQFLGANTNLALLLALREGWTSVNTIPGVVEQFVHQAMRHCESSGTQLTPDKLETCVSSHFKASLPQLGQPSADDLLLQNAKECVNASSDVIYWGACVGTAEPSDSEVGVLGWLEPERAIAALTCAPILKNLEEHLLWDVTFAPSHGSLASFLSVHRTPSCRILEIEPNLHVRIFDASSAKDFRASCFSEDSRAAVAHLLSIFVRAGYAQKDLLVTFASQALEQMGGSGSVRPVSFIYSCLEAMPTASVREILAPILLEPMKGILANFADQMLELSNVNRTVLHHIGFQHGIEAWIQDFRDNLSRNSASSAVQHCEQDLVAKPEALEKTDTTQVIETGLARVSEEPVPDRAKDQEKPVIESNHDSHVYLKPSFGTPPARRVVDAQDRSAARILIEEISNDPDLQGDRLMRAMDKISVELYSQKEHFVMGAFTTAF